MSHVEFANQPAAVVDESRPNVLGQYEIKRAVNLTLKLLCCLQILEDEKTLSNMTVNKVRYVSFHVESILDKYPEECKLVDLTADTMVN